jgi:Cu(I)/Ag(I) efflux system protein CusF
MAAPGFLHATDKQPSEKTMKFILATALVAITAPALAADHNHGSHGNHGTMQNQASAETPLIEGLVKKIDKAAGKVTVSHGPLPNGMPAMTMVFRIKEAAWIDQMKEGDKIRFKADQVNGAMTMVRFEPVKG